MFYIYPIRKIKCLECDREFIQEIGLLLFCKNCKAKFLNDTKKIK